MALPSDVVLHVLAPRLKHLYSDLSHFLTDRHYAHSLYRHLTKLDFDQGNIWHLSLFGKLTVLSIDLRSDLNLSQLKNVTDLKLRGTRCYRQVAQLTQMGTCYLQLPPKVAKLGLVSVFGVDPSIMDNIPITELRARELIWLIGNNHVLPKTVTYLDTPFMGVVMIDYYDTNDDTWCAPDEHSSKLVYVDVDSLDTFSQCTALIHWNTKRQTVFSEDNFKLTHLGCVGYTGQTLPPCLTSLEINIVSIYPTVYPSNLTSLAIGGDEVDPRIIPRSVTKLSVGNIKMPEIDLYPPNLTDLNTEPMNLNGSKLPASITRLTLGKWHPSIIPETLKELAITFDDDAIDVDVSGLKHLTHFEDWSHMRWKITLPDSVTYLAVRSNADVPEYPSGLLYYSNSNGYISKIPHGLLFLVIPETRVSYGPHLSNKLIYLCCRNDIRFPSEQFPNLKYNIGYYHKVRNNVYNVPDQIFRRMLAEGDFAQ